MNIVDKILVDPITRGLKFFTKGTGQGGVEIIGKWRPYTPVLNNSITASTNVAWWRPVGDSIEIFGNVTSNTNGGAVAVFRMGVPTQFTVDLAVIGGAAAFGMLGPATFSANVTIPYHVYCVDSGTFSFISPTGGDINANGFTSGSSITYRLTIPVTQRAGLNLST